jgi:hypothetical protein
VNLFSVPSIPSEPFVNGSLGFAPPLAPPPPIAVKVKEEIVEVDTVFPGPTLPTIPLPPFPIVIFIESFLLICIGCDKGSFAV